MKIKALTFLLFFGFISASLSAQKLGENELSTAMDHYKNKQYAEAAVWFEKAARLGNTTAQYNLGICYEDGKGVTASMESAIQWYSKAAELGYAKAQNMVGGCYEKGNGVKQSYSDAAAWYKKAADHGYAMAQNNLGVLYDGGLGVAQSYPEAIKYYKAAADQDYAKAKFNLGILYFKGLGVTLSRTDAIQYWIQAANDGYLPAMKLLGAYYELLEPNKDGYKQAFKWFTKASEYQDADAIYQLGLMYDNGVGTDQNADIAEKAYNLAAVLGSQPAKLALASIQAEPKVKVQQKEKPKRPERQWVQVMCMACVGSGKIHHTIPGGGIAYDSYGNKSIVYGEYSSCTTCGGKGTVSKMF